MKMALIEDTLSDGTKAYGVRLYPDSETYIDLECYSKKHALSLMGALFDNGACGNKLSEIKLNSGW